MDEKAGAKKYTVEITKAYYKTWNTEVEAESEDDAFQKACENMDLTDVPLNGCPEDDTWDVREK